MPLRSTLFGLMARIVRANADLLKAYRTDFWLHDQYALQYFTRPGDEYIWILRDHGTELFRLYQGDDPLPVAYWLTPQHSHSRAYHVSCTGENGYGTVRPVTRDEAIALARMPQRAPLTLTPRERQLLDHLKEVLACIGYSHHHHVRRATELVDRLEFTARAG